MASLIFIWSVKDSRYCIIPRTGNARFVKNHYLCGVSPVIQAEPEDAKKIAAL